jgi:hypothetical protein
VKPLALFVSLFLFASATTPAAQLTERDIAELRKICEALVGVGTGSDDWRSALDKLRGYAESGVAFQMFHFVCDGSRCSGTLALRDSSEIVLSFAQTRGYDPVGSGRIDTVLLRKRGKTIFSVGDNGGRDSHKGSNHALELTDARCMSIFSRAPFLSADLPLAPSGRSSAC